MSTAGASCAFSAGMIYQQLPEQLEHVALALATGPAPILPDRVD
ncbi:hypothetical protein ACFS07_33365 [Undibacterium arcticum]